VQEALTNAYKHAEANKIEVILQHTSDGVGVTIQDNGRGLSLPADSDKDAEDGEHQRFYSGHGIKGMRERATELGGSLEIAQIATGGVQVQAWIPN
jgi:signal transduction histidine kinase